MHTLKLVLERPVSMSHSANQKPPDATGKTCTVPRLTWKNPRVALPCIVLQQQRADPVTQVLNIVVITHKVLRFFFNLLLSNYF